MISKSEKKIKQLKREFTRFKNDPPPSFIVQHIGKLQSVLPEDQWTLMSTSLRNAQRNQHGRRFSEAAKTLASKLYYRNPASYKNFLDLGFPSIVTLNRFNQDKVSRTGWSAPVEKYLKHQAELLSDLDKLSVLAFDETELKPCYTYNGTLDSVDGFVDLGHLGREGKEAKKVLVFILRGLKSKYKQAVSYYLTDGSLDSLKLKKIIEFNIRKCTEVGFSIVAILSDGDAKNRKAAKDFGSTIDDPSFSFDGRRMAFIFDVPHIIKLLRNQLLVRDLSVELHGSRGIVS